MLGFRTDAGFPIGVCFEVDTRYIRFLSMLSANRQIFLAYQLTRSREPVTGICLVKDMFHTPRKNLRRQPEKMSFATLKEALDNFNRHSDIQTNYSSDLAVGFLEACRAGRWPQHTVSAKHEGYIQELRGHFVTEHGEVSEVDSADISVRVSDDDTSSADSHFQTTSKRRRLEVCLLSSVVVDKRLLDLPSWPCTTQDDDTEVSSADYRPLSWQVRNRDEKTWHALMTLMRSHSRQVQKCDCFCRV